MKKTLALLLSIITVFSAASCGSAKPAAAATTTAATEAVSAASETEAETAESEAPEETPAEEAVYPMTITDQAGREVVIESKPEKLVSGYYISTSAMIALGLEKNLVGIEAKADKRAIYKLSAPELIDLPNVGTAKEFNLEGCVALEPDLVVLPIKLKSVVEDLENFGIKVILVNPETEDQLDEMIGIIAKVTGTTEKADKLKTFTNNVKEQLAPLAESAPTVYLAGNSSLLSTAGAAMYQSDMIKAAGGENVADGISDTYWAEVSYEDILAWNPEYIIIASDAEYSADDVMTDPNLENVTAIKDENVYKLPSKAEAWDSPVPSGILGSVWVASKLHADEISEWDCNDLADRFYTEFYGFKYSKAE